jgi:transposase-like protein
VSLDEIARLSGGSDAIKVEFVEREATPTELMELAIHLHLSELSLADIVSVLDRFDICRARSTVHNRVQKAILEPRIGRNPEKIALDETTQRPQRRLLSEPKNWSSDSRCFTMEQLLSLDSRVSSAISTSREIR